MATHKSPVNIAFKNVSLKGVLCRLFRQVKIQSYNVRNDGNLLSKGDSQLLKYRKIV